MSWEDYFEKIKDRPLRPLYLNAISLVDTESATAMDLGCGAGTETADLLKRGFLVHAIDQEARAIELVKSRCSKNKERLHTQVSTFEQLTTWPTVDFFYAYHSLPFCARTNFHQVVMKTLEIVSVGGLYVASVFGPDDAWAIGEKVVGISSEALKLKLRDFEILHFDESKKIGKTAVDGEKMWHVIEVIARKVKS